MDKVTQRAFDRALLEHKVQGAHRSDFQMIADIARLAQNTLDRAEWLANAYHGYFGGAVANGVVESLRAIVAGCDKHMEVPDFPAPPARK